ncbi:MAG TPA: SDR family oxidoreductase [Anaerolineales bacterium]
MILIVGASGQLGGLITDRLLSQGREVRILTRQNPAYQSFIDRGAQGVPADLKDRASLDAVCEGVKVVITTANSARRGGEDNPQTVELQGNRNLIDAGKAAKVDQFIFTSANVADPNSPIPFVAGKGKSEEYLASSDLPYTILAPEAFMEVWIAMLVGMPALSGNPVTLVGTGERKHTFISVHDVVEFALAAIDHPSAINQRLVLGGPEPLSFRYAVRMYERVLGRVIPVETVAPGEPIPDLPEHVWALAASFDMYDSIVDMERTARTFGVTLTPLEKVVQKMVAPQAT